MARAARNLTALSTDRPCIQPRASHRPRWPTLAAWWAAAPAAVEVDVGYESALPWALVALHSEGEHAVAVVALTR
ncbi:hypothetical protein [Roseateles sp. BYS87W]|uniref:Uncharacterized protein n=1 Tax=Pelomonas baiyunensis TaxID=3299026 RepID=A0ABW7H0T0_9BURK